MYIEKRMRLHNIDTIDALAQKKKSLQLSTALGTVNILESKNH